MLAGLERSPAHIKVEIVGGCDDDELQVGIFDGLVRVTIDGDAGVGTCSVIPASLHDGREFEAGDRVKDGGVKELTRRPESYDASTYAIRHKQQPRSVRFIRCIRAS